ncbi:hypothetical protein MJO29_003779 [Puccinia striiformis f. sp. tritici]|nr:hypothetical protein MJO29_003779 [Puccinia striiformis f. sp. tritici]
MTSINLPLGISIGLLASFIQSLGLTIQRKSHLQNDRLPLSSRKPDYLRPVWLIGFTIYFSFNILGSIFQIGTLPLIILGPLGAISLLWNAILARFLLADTFSIHLIFGTILIGLGALLIGIYGLIPDQSASHNLEQLIYLYSRTPFLVEIIILILTFSIICSFAHLHEYRLNQTLETISLLTISPNLTPPTTQLQSRSSSTNSQSNNHNNNDHSLSRNYSSSNPISLSYPHQPIDIIESHIPLTPPFSTASHLQSNNNNSNSNKRHHQQSRLSRTIYHPSGSPLLQLSSIDNKDENGGCDHELLSNQKIDRLKLLIGIAYGSTSGTLSGICLLFAKTGVELLIKSLTGTVNEFAKVQTWLILFVLLVSALLQLWYLNKALRLVNPTLICPLAFCFYNLSSIISSLVYYDQLKLLSNFQIFAISTGTIILLGGVWVVSIGTTTNTSNTHNTLKQLDDQEEEEGRVNENEEEEEEEEDHHNENEATPLLPSSSKIGGGHSSEEEEEEEQELSEEYTEDSIGMDDATSSLKPEDHRRPSYNNSRRNTLLLHPPTASTSTTTGSSSNHRLSQDNCRRRSSFQTAHPFDHLIRQFMADGDVTPVRGFSIGLGAASPGFAIRPKKRLARKSGDGYLIGRSSLSRHSHERDLYHHHHLSHQSSPAQRQQQQQPEQEQEDHEEEQPNQEQQTQDGSLHEQSQWDLHQHRQASLEPDRDHPPDPHRHSYS